ncbi:cytochrome c oxidase assembly protein [Falsirhodobacter halotolerans]|uniref:cytochrome c oxidase assembly protein n=1 Tax=Falsirhodobacter halotolerans TaxID=1146892 RepID=UPI001FD45082|nr:cytochrome c oxidase assembly protein [Falsirhodobacter halotolerans]MCJ8139979.1 cytochrome c oxidase assembly protein [Falsirhodobacter halotolerans]
MAILFMLLPILVLAAYAIAAKRDGTWPALRGWSFTLGIAMIVAAMSSPVQDWAHRDLRGHMAQHLLLGMFAPLAFALGAPGTLLLRRVPVGVARMIVAFLGSVPVRAILHPVTTAVLNVGGMYALYLTPFFTTSMSDPVLYIFIHVHFVVAGYLYVWSIAGPDPAPHRPGFGIRLAVLILATGAHATLGKLMYLHARPAGTGADLATVQQAAQWMYYGGDLAEGLLAAAFFGLWFRRQAGSRPRALSTMT